MRDTERVVLWILVLNMLVAAIKAAYGAWSGSLAVGSDAIHSFTDGISNVLGFVALRVAARPPNPRHPYGYRRVELIAASGVGLAIAAMSLRFGWGAIQGLVNRSPPPEATVAGIAALIFTLLVNVWVARYEARRGRELHSPFLVADAAHTASDVVVTTGVIGSQFMVRFDVPYADPVVALGVVAFIGVVAARIIQANLGQLTDVSFVDAKRIEQEAKAIPGVLGVHRTRSRGTPGAALLDLHLTVDGNISVAAAHEISHQLEDHLKKMFPEIVDVTIHVEPQGDAEEPL